jgi:hypothetical protein
MGLWLKCPGCQASNPLFLKGCPHCGQDLSKLPAAQRVYVIGPAAAPSSATSPGKTPAVPKAEKAAVAAKPAKKPKGTKKKSS